MDFNRIARSFSTALIVMCAFTAVRAQPIAPSSHGDILTPNEHDATPTLRIGVRAGFNRSSYTNDRYLDNVPFDVGDISGETEIYSSSAGFGYGGGIDVEYPLNVSMSLVASLEYQHVVFSSSGSVSEPCVRHDGTRLIGSSIHEFDASLDLLTAALTARVDFSDWFLLAGLAAGHPVSTSLTRIRTFGSSDCFYPDSGEQTRLEEHGTIPIPARVHYAIRLGAGLSYDLGNHFHFAPELTLDFGVNAINKSPNSDLGVYSVMATLRYDIR